jgi:CHASE2 domain-containing sensor protein
MMPTDKTGPMPENGKSQNEVRPLSLVHRIVRALPAILFLVLLVTLLGHLGILHKLETVASDAQMQLNRVPWDSRVAIVTITNDDYRDIFGGTSPLNPRKLEQLIDDISKGEPSVICVDIDTSAAQFKNNFNIGKWRPHIVWEREVSELPEDADIANKEKIEPLDVLGGKQNLDPSINSTGLALLKDDAEDKVTRRYNRVIPTRVGNLPSLPWATVEAYFKDNPDQLATISESGEDLLIRFSSDPQRSHRVNLTASKVHELALQWPIASPIRNKIVVLGGSFLGQDRHDTPIGRIAGDEVIANVVETELNGGGYKPPSKLLMFILELFEGFFLILIFHICRLLNALVTTVLLAPLLAIICSLIAFGDWIHIWHFLPILLGLIFFEVYEHYRRRAVPRLYHDLTGSAQE